jgi:hypothetical protein
MNWRTIKYFGQVKYFNISYVVLIIVPLLANTFEMLNEKYGFQLFIPYTVKSLYFASIIYAIAIAIYQYRCPEIIKEYLNLQDYIDKNLEQFKNKAPDLKFYIVLAHLDQTTQAATYNEIVELNAKVSDTTSEPEKIKHKIVLNEKLNLVYPSSVQTHLERKYNEANSKESFSYWVSGLLYLVGSLIILTLLIIRTALVFNN